MRAGTDYDHNDINIDSQLLRQERRVKYFPTENPRQVR